jgi:flavin reductase (DIM6/NTAB) family NADH-FMN oxidoreductase RutF
LFNFFRKSTRNEAFVDSPMRDNWYQASSYYLSSFALITTVNEAGVTSIGPYQLTMPFEVINDRSFMVISRPTSNTVANVRRTQKCALNFVEFNRRQLKTILDMGYPGQTPEEKMKDSCFTLVDSPTPGRESSATCPKIVKEAFQVYECTWEEDREFEKLFLKRSTSAHLVLRIDNILLKETWKKNLENGGERMPRMPVTYGFRGGSKFWFAEPKPAFWLPIPTNKGPKYEVVHYEANRIDDEIKFTLEASKELTGIPKPFLRTALKGIVKEAKDRGVTTIDRDFILMLNKERKS